MNSHEPSVGRARWGIRALVLAAAGVAFWFIFFGPGATEPESPAEQAVLAKAPAGDNSKIKPWAQPTGKSGQSSVVAGNPAPQTPVLDEWMEKNWNQQDDQLIDGLILFAQDTTMASEDRLGATRHALNLLSEKDIGKLTPLIDNPSTPPDILNEVISNLHNRGEFGAITASLRLLKRPEPEIALEAKKLLAFVLDMDEQNENEALRLQGETRLIELAEAPPPEPVQELAPDAPVPATAITNQEP